MSKKKSAQKNIPNKPSENKKPQKNAAGGAIADGRRVWIAVAILAVVTFWVFYPTSSKIEFTNWDDGTYVSENPDIWKLDAQHVKNLFINPPEKRTGSFFSWFPPVSLNYHPLTMLSLEINYHYSKLDARPYVITNNIIHILNVILVFLFVNLFMRRYSQRSGEDNFRPDSFVIALVTSALWAIHPMRVESVTWIAERKDVLYMFFFMLSLIFYVRWLDNKKMSGMLLCFVFFVCSCLSKGMAVVLPMMLVLIDWFLGEARTIRQIVQSAIKKWYFFFASFAFGVIAFKIQSQGAIAAMETFSLFQRLTFGCYGFIMYIWKLLLPVNLSAFYPYPFTDAQGNIPAIYYASPFLVLLLAGAIIFTLVKKPAVGKVLAFGFLFYFIAVMLVLQFLSVGSVIMADRYSYLSYVGLFFMVGYFLEYARKKYASSVFPVFAAALIGAACVFAYLTRERTKVWATAETLWTDALNQFPFIEIGYENRGIYYKDHNQLDKMQKDYEIVTGIDQSKVKLAPTRNEKIWSNLGNLYGLQQKFDKSLNAYSKAIEYNPTNASTYLNRAITLSMMGQYAQSIPDYNKSMELDPNVALTYKNRAYTLLQLGQFDKSISDYDKALQLYSYDTLSYLNRGISKFNAKRFPEAIDDFNKFISMSPNNPQAYYNVSIAYKNIGKYKEALEYAQKAQEHGQKVGQDYINELKSKAK